MCVSGGKGNPVYRGNSLGGVGMGYGEDEEDEGDECQKGEIV